MYSDESGHSESEFLLFVGRDFEPNGAYISLSQLKKEEIPKKYVIYRARSVRMGKNCALGLEYGPRHSFFPYGPPAR